jgi:hypothetical protein
MRTGRVPCRHRYSPAAVPSDRTVANRWKSTGSRLLTSCSPIRRPAGARPSGTTHADGGSRVPRYTRTFLPLETLIFQPSPRVTPFIVALSVSTSSWVHNRFFIVLNQPQLQNQSESKFRGCQGVTLTCIRTVRTTARPVCRDLAASS